MYKQWQQRNANLKNQNMVSSTWDQEKASLNLQQNNLALPFQTAAHTFLVTNYPQPNGQLVPHVGVQTEILHVECMITNNHQ